MEGEKFNSDATDGKKEVLTSIDKRYLAESAKKITQQILADYPNILPDGIILPDTTARPLMYLFDEIFSRVAAQRQVAKPRFFFFSVSPTQSMWQTANLEKWYHAPAEEAIEKKSRDIEEHKESNPRRSAIEKGTHPPGVWELMSERLEYDRENIKEARFIQQFLQLRADEIKNYVGNENAEFIIMDDYATEDADTIREIRKAFGKQLKAFIDTT